MRYCGKFAVFGFGAPAGRRLAAKPSGKLRGAAAGGAMIMPQAASPYKRGNSRNRLFRLHFLLSSSKVLCGNL